MKVQKVIRRRIRRQDKGMQLAADINAVVAANVGDPGSRTNVRSRSRQRIVQRSGQEPRTDPPEGGEQDG